VVSSDKSASSLHPMTPARQGSSSLEDRPHSLPFVTWCRDLRRWFPFRRHKTLGIEIADVTVTLHVGLPCVRPCCGEVAYGGAGCVTSRLQAARAFADRRRKPQGAPPLTLIGGHTGAMACAWWGCHWEACTRP
jgi:hypothetical protein